MNLNVSAGEQLRAHITQQGTPAATPAAGHARQAGSWFRNILANSGGRVGEVSRDLTGIAPGQMVSSHIAAQEVAELGLDATGPTRSAVVGAHARHGFGSIVNVLSGKTPGGTPVNKAITNVQSHIQQAQAPVKSAGAQLLENLRLASPGIQAGARDVASHIAPIVTPATNAVRQHIPLNIAATAGAKIPLEAAKIEQAIGAIARTLRG